MPTYQDDPYLGSNMLGSIRRRNIFQNSDPTLAQGAMGGGPDFSVESIRSAEPEIETQARDRLLAQLDVMPERERSGIMRRILGSIVGAGRGPAEARAFMDAPHNRAMADWKVKTDALGDLAAIENQDNTQRRAYWQENERTRRFEEGEARRNRLADETIRKNAAREQMDAELLNLKKWQALHPRWRPHTEAETGELIYTNPEDPTAKPIRMGIKVSDLSPLQRIAANLESDLILEGERQENRLELKDTPDSGSDQKVKEYIAARKWVAEHPNAGTYLKLDTDGANTFRFIAPGGIKEWWSPGVQAEYKQAIEAIYGSGQAAPAPGVEQAAPPAEEIKVPNAGNIGSVRQPQVNPDAALRQEAVEILTAGRKLINKATIKATVEKLKAARNTRRAR